MSSMDPQEISDRACERLDKRFGELTSRLRRDGKVDRAALGRPDPTFGDGVASLLGAFTRLARAITARSRVWPNSGNPDVVRVRTSHGSHIEPPLDQAWSMLDKLRWNAAVTEIDCGLQMKVEEVAVGVFCVFVDPGWSAQHMSYEQAWSHIVRLGQGAAAYRRQKGLK